MCYTFHKIEKTNGKSPDSPSETKLDTESEDVVEGTKPNSSGMLITSSEESGNKNSFETEHTSNEESLLFKKPHQTSKKSGQAPNPILDKVEFINQQTRDTPFSTEHDFFF